MRTLLLCSIPVYLAGCQPEPPLPQPSRAPTFEETNICYQRAGKDPIPEDRSGGTFFTEEERLVLLTCLAEVTA
ncbi:MAG: hypothetical protein WBA25_03345 [Jannaschia sp.]